MGCQHEEKSVYILEGSESSAKVGFLSTLTLKEKNHEWPFLYDRGIICLDELRAPDLSCVHT